jgi:drug/metabolite transporter (DMT)-like permease
MPSMATKPGYGASLAIVSAAAFGTSGSFGSSLIEAGWSPAAAVTARVVLAAAVLAVPAGLQLRGRWHLVGRSLPSVLAFGLVAVAACQLCYFNAVAHLSVSVALLLEYSGILLVVLWLWARQGQRPRRLTAIGGGVTLVGLALVLNLTAARHVELAGVLWGLGAATGLACYFVLCARTEEALPPMAMAWAGMVVGAVALVALDAVGLLRFHIGGSTVAFAHHRVSWVVPVLGLALIAGALAYATGIGATRWLGAKLASFVGLTEVLFATLFAWLLLGQQPGLLQALGGLFVIGGIALIRIDEPPVGSLPVSTEPETVLVSA